MAFSIYASRYREVLPCADWGTNWNQQSITWDDLINYDLGGNFDWDDMTASSAPRPVPVMHCPADVGDTPDVIPRFSSFD